jgi:hypothetical protein
MAGSRLLPVASAVLGVVTAAQQQPSSSPPSSPAAAHAHLKYVTWGITAPSTGPQEAGNPPYNLTESEPYTTSPIVLHRVLDGVAAAIEGVQRASCATSTILKTDDAPEVASSWYSRPAKTGTPAALSVSPGGFTYSTDGPAARRLKMDDLVESELPYATDGGNFQCRQPFGGSPEEYPLPCRAPADDYSSRAAHEFVITAWWAPLIASTDDHGEADQLQEYKQAGFNAVRTSNVAAFCQHLKLIPTPATADEAFGCIANASRRIDKAGLMSIFAPGHWEVTPTITGATFGGNGSLGGLTSRSSSGQFDSIFPRGTINIDGPSLITAPELAWIKSEASVRNVSFAAIFLHDDSFRVAADTAHQTKWLSKHWTASPGMTNGGTSDPVGLYRSRQFVLSPEEYSVHGEPGSNATQMAYSQLMMYQANAYVAQRYRLRSWPIFALGDGGFIKDITSDSLIYLQVYGALAFGAKGLDYYCWGNAIWRVTVNGSSFAKGVAMSTYPHVRTANIDAQRWGTQLFNTTHHGVISTFIGTHNDTEMPSHHRPLAHDRLGPAPGVGLPVIAMDAQLVAGVFSDTRISESGFLMFVDCRVSLTAGKVPSRTVSITLAPACQPALAPSGSGTRPPSAFSWSHVTDTVTLTLAAGMGALVKVEGDGCGELLRNVQSWILEPRRISTLDLTAAPPVDGGVGTEIYVRTMEDSQRRAVSTAGGGKPDRTMLIGASYYGEIHSSLEARELAEAGFSLVTLNATDINATARSLMWADAYGFSVLGRVSGASTVADVVDRFGCHTNFGGLHLVPAARQQVITDQHASTFAQTMRHSQHWGVPLVGGAGSVTTVDDVVRLASLGLPLAAVHVPVTKPQQVLDLFRGLGGALWHNATIAATVSLAIPVCQSNSDSLLRFAAFSSLGFAFRPDGSQNLGAIIWDMAGDCKPVVATIGSPKFRLLASINARIAQWTTPFAKRSSSAAMWSTSSLKLPGSHGPGHVPNDLIVSMDSELMIMELNSSVIYVISTQLAPSAGGAPPREVEVVLRPNVSWTQAMEGNQFQGEAACKTRRIGNRLLLVLPGGSGQLVEYGIGVDDTAMTKSAVSRQRRWRPLGF